MFYRNAVLFLSLINLFNFISLYFGVENEITEGSLELIPCVSILVQFWG